LCDKYAYAEYAYAEYVTVYVALGDAATAHVCDILGMYTSEKIIHAYTHLYTHTHTDTYHNIHADISPAQTQKYPFVKKIADLSSFYVMPETHLGYSLTWYGMSVAMTIGTYYRFFRQRRR
jgi:hypothetical protein